MILKPILRSPHSSPLHGLFGRAIAPDGAILHWDAAAGWQDQTGNQQAVLIGSAYPTVTAGFAVNASGAEWGFDLASGAVRTAFLAGEVTIRFEGTFPAMSSLTDATDYSLWGDVLFVRRDGTAGSFKLSDGTNTATVAYDWSENEVVTLICKSFGGVTVTAAKAPGAYYVENVIRNRACTKLPSGIASYTNGAYHIECAGGEGDTTLTVTGGDSAEHAGSAIWKAVIEYPDGELEFNIVDVVSGQTCTIVYPLKKSGPVKVWCAWGDSQHYSLVGSKCYAETLYRLDRRYAVRDESVYSHYYSDVFTTNPWSGLNPLIWTPFGGLATNMFNVSAGDANPFTGVGGRYFAGHKRHVSMTTTAAGHGLRVTIPVSDPFTGRIEFSTGANIETQADGLAVVTVDGVTVYSQSFGLYVRTHQVYVENATNIVITVTRTTTGTTSITYKIGALHLIRNVGAEGALIDKDKKILLCGDSWFSDAHPTGVGFKVRLAELIAADGGTGTLVNESLGGMTTRWAIQWLPVFLAEHNPDVCILNFFTNDNNITTGTFLGPDGESYDLDTQTWDEWGQNIEQLVQMCLASNCTPIVMLPDTTSSLSQTNSHMFMQDYAGRPVLVKEWITKATASELLNAAYVGNVRNKVPGRVIKNAQTSVDYVATSSVASSAWVAGKKVINITVGDTAGAHGLSDGILPTDGQVFKSHAIPIAAKKLTVFPGVAAASQLNEAAS